MSTDTGRRLDEVAVLELVRLHGELVVKPRFGGGGGKIRFLRVEDAGLVVNNQRMAFPDFVRLLRQEEHVVTDRIYQHEYASRVYTDSTDTIRIVTMIDVDRGMPLIAAAVHRFGTSASFPIDNWSKGGISAPVDVETGTLGVGATFPGRHPTRMHQRHPDSGDRNRRHSSPSLAGDSRRHSVTRRADASR